MKIEKRKICQYDSLTSFTYSLGIFFFGSVSSWMFTVKRYLFLGIYFWIQITLKQILNYFALFMLIDQIVKCPVILSLPFSFFFFFLIFFHPAIISPNMLCSTHLGMQIGKIDMQKKKTREKEVRVLTTSTVNSFQPRPAGLQAGVAHWLSRAFARHMLKGLVHDIAHVWTLTVADCF